jgi:two-component system, LytTR family, response regulator
MIINCIAIDDEPPARTLIKGFILKVPYLKLLNTFKDGISGIEFIKLNDVDLVFLDIEMGGLSGIQLLKALNKKPKIIITTAYRNYAIDAFDLDVTDYLLKPLSFERFLKAVDKVYDLICKEKEIFNTQKAQRDFMFVKTEYKMQRINFDDILYIEGLCEYLIIKTKTSKITTLQSFKNIEKLLPKSNFIRVHKSYMVALDKIDLIEKHTIKIGDKKIPVGDKFKNNFFNTISK